MSWSLSVTSPTPESVSASIDAALNELHHTVREHVDPEQIAAAKDAAVALALTVARPGDTVSISMGGHHNADKIPVSGWSNDTVHVTVGQIATP